MSFDIKIISGDFSFDSQGRFNLVRDNNKLVQDVLKLINTTLGADAFVPNYGVSITNVSIGALTTANVIAQQLEAEILTGIQRIQQEQQSLEQQQLLTPAERIQNIDQVFVEQDEVDPRQYNIFIELTTQARTPITVNTEVRA